MNKVLEFVMYYLIYLVPGFLGVWLGSLFIGVDINPFTNWLPYVFALIFAIVDYRSSNKEE